MVLTPTIKCAPTHRADLADMQWGCDDHGNGLEHLQLQGLGEQHMKRRIDGGREYGGPHNGGEIKKLCNGHAWVTTGEDKGRGDGHSSRGVSGHGARDGGGMKGKD